MDSTEYNSESSEKTNVTQSEVVSNSDTRNNTESCIEVENKDSTEKCIAVETQDNTESHTEVETDNNTESCVEKETKNDSENCVEGENNDNTVNLVEVETNDNRENCVEEEIKDNSENCIEVGTKHNAVNCVEEETKDNTVSCVEEAKDKAETCIEEKTADSTEIYVEKETGRTENDTISCVREENENDTESCIEKTLEKEKTSFDNVEVNETIPSEIDSSSLNIETDAVEVTVEDVEKEMEISLSEKTNTINAQIEEISESLSRENTSIDADKKTEPSVTDLTKKCDTVTNQSQNLETVHKTDLHNTKQKLHDTGDNTKQDSRKVPDEHTEQNTDTTNYTKSASGETENEVEMLASDKNKETNVTDESSIHVDDVQMQNQKETDASKKLETESSDSNAENTDKDTSEKNVEPEKTEFVQFSQDKNDDSQIEGQSMDAEDPFGGDNLTSENVEQMEVTNLADDEINFKNLYSDNLQDAVNAKNNDSNKKSTDNSGVKKIMANIAATSSEVRDILRNSPMETDPSDVNESETGAEKTSSAKSSDEQDEQTRKDNEAVTPMETDEPGNTDVLPGQDDELCIIPDNMKVIMPNKTGQATSNGKSSALDKDVEENKTTEKCSESNSELNKDDSQDKAETVSTKQSSIAIIKEAMATEKADIVTDVINVEEEMKTSEVEEIPVKETCKQCGEDRACKIQVKIGTETYRVCSKTCRALFKMTANKKTADVTSNDLISSETSSKRDKRCASCLLIIEANDDRNLSWETMEFCNEECLGKFQKKYGSYCKNCNGSVQPVSLGKYCVRFGCDVRQFCCSTCLEEFKKGLKVCSYCQKDISSGDGFLAPVGEKGQFKDFCTQDCMEKYSKLNSAEPPAAEKKPCGVCKEEKLVHCEVQIYNSTPVAICSEPCFAAFKFVKQVKPEQCSTCKKFFELPNKQHFIVFYENEPHTFCNKTCLNIFIITNRKIVPCNWCKVKKYNFDMIKKELKLGQTLMMCSLNCLTLYQVSMNAVSAKRINCDCCKEYSLAHYHLTMSDATIRNFCSYNCVMNFQAQYTKSPITIPSSDDPVPTGMPKKTTLPQRGVNQTPSEMQNKKTMPVISSVTSLAAIANGQASPTAQQNNMATQMVYNQQIITRPSSPVRVHNKTTQCKPLVHTKGVNVRPHPCTRGTQTNEKFGQTIFVPVPVPIYVPYPMHMYSMPFPVPMPFPLPIPVPIFIPTTKNSYKGIMKEIKRIQEKIPSDPYEAELLMMAEMVATEKKTNDSDSDLADDREGDQNNDDSGPEADSNAFEDDVLQMALKMATEDLEEPAVDLEAALTPSTITATQTPAQPENIDNDVQSERLIISHRGRKRVVPYKPRTTPKRRRVSGTNEIPLMPPPKPQLPPQPRIIEPIEKPDANMTLKYTFGVNAWRQWVIGKNAELEKQMTVGKKTKLFKTDLLQLTADELNYSLCLFLKEVRKPNGTEYAPDTIYYLCLGIQQYLFENNRIDNIFTDSYYERFTDCLNEIAKKFSVIYNDAQYIVTRVEEEHLWECKQLGAHSPHVLLSTLMYFNTKHFNLVTVEEHMQLSFSHIMKHWKRNPAAQPTTVTGKGPSTRNVLLRFYPPQSALEANSRKKKVYEQQENEENPLRCPVKLYEFYLSKCPESVKTRNDVFYLLPERSCVPDSPVWYSTSPLAKEHLIKTLYRIKMVKEINVALLTS